MLSKRGSHVGVILSFMIFIVFVVFLFSALQPALKIEKDKEAILEYLTNSIIELSSDNVTIENIIIENKNNEDCVEVVKIESEKNILVKNSSGNAIPYKIGEKLIIPLRGKGKSLFKIYYSNSIVQKNSDVECSKTSTNPEIGFVTTESVVFIPKFDAQIKKNYDSLKEELGINAGTEFSFGLLSADKKIVVGTEEKNISENVYVNEFPILYSDENGEIKSGFINIRVW